MEPRGERGPHKPAKDGSSVQWSLVLSNLSPKRTRSDLQGQRHMPSLPEEARRDGFQKTFHQGRTNPSMDFSSSNFIFNGIRSGKFECSGRQTQSEKSNSSDRRDIPHQALQPIRERWGNQIVDLFASQYRHRLPLYVSPMRDHKAIGKDALARSWANMEVYAYPPTSLFSKVLAKAAIERPRLVLIAPFWRASPWFPDLMSLAREGPVFLNLNEKTLVQPRSDIGNEGTAFLNLTSWLL